MLLRNLFNRKWILTTILVIAAVAVMIRLGVWQLDRLEQRRIFSERVTAQRDDAKLILSSETMSQDLYEMEYRAVEVTGEYAHSQEVALSNQVWDRLLGIHLLTPMKINGTEMYVLVDRGWIPSEDYSPNNWNKYQEPGQITVEGVIRRPQTRPTFGGLPDPTLTLGQTRLTHWKNVNLERIQLENGLPMLPIYIQQTPHGEQTKPPLRAVFNLELSEGPHMGYALQWFAFAAILAIGYPVYVHAHSIGEVETGSFHK
jgi:surfeit locus 1 family protein